MRFYEATLGLTPPPRWSAEGYVPVHAGAVTIGIQHHRNLSADHHFSPARLSGPRGVGVEVDDIDAAYAVASIEATRHGGRVEPLMQRTWGATDFRLVDPDGYYIRVTSRLH